MPRIRKKTSKRISTHQRAKFKHKVAEGRKKKKKEAKKNPQWKSKKKKDPGIPNNFPYKDQILSEIAETRRQAEDDKRRRREEKKAAREGLLVEAETADNDVSLDGGPSLSSKASKVQRKNEAPLLLNPDLPNLEAVLEKVDVVLFVLDARDPTSYRLPHIEDLAAVQSKLVFILNKIDLVPRETLAEWVGHLRTRHTAFLFRSASMFLPKTPLNDPKAKGKAKETADDSLGSEALLEYLGQRANGTQDATLQVAVVGLTNTGKSAIVNSLARKAVVPIYIPTAATEAWATTTTRAFEVPVKVGEHSINIVDTPGISLQNEEEHDEAIKTRDMLLRSRGRVDKVKDPVPAVESIVSRAETQDLMVHYNLPAFSKGDCAAFLAGVARSKGFFKKGGDPDLTQAARIVLRDYTTGKLPFYTEAPEGCQPVSVSEALEKLYGRGDGEVLAGARTRRDMRTQGGLVKFMRGEVEKRRIVLDARFVVEEDRSEEGDGDGDEDEIVPSPALMDEDVPSPPLTDEHVPSPGLTDEDISTPGVTGSRKRKAAAGTTVSRARKVVFAAGTLDNEKQQTRKRKVAIPAKSRYKKPDGNPKKGASKPVAKSQPTAGDTYDFDQFFKP